MKQKDIDQLLAAGLISPELAEAIAEHFHLNGNRGRQWLVWVMSILAGALILGGIIMLISANWETIPDVVKMAVAMLLLLGFWIAWARTRGEYPLIAEGLGLVGGGMWLGCIALYGQIFQLQTPFAEGCMLFFLGVCVFPFVVQNRALALVVAVTSAILLGALMENNGSWLSLSEWLSRDSAAMSAYALLAFLWWVLAERWRSSKGFYRSYAWMGIPAMLCFLFMVQIPLLYQAFRYEKGATELLLGAAPLLLVVARPRDCSWLHWGLMMVLLSLPLPVGMLLKGNEAELLGILFGFGIGGGMMYLGYAARRVAWLNYGSLMVMFSGIALIANVLESLTESGLVLIIAGLVLLGLVWLLEKQRRMLAKSIKENQ